MKLKDSIILVVVFIIAIALGVFIGIKVTERKTDNNNNNQPTKSEMDDKSNSGSSKGENLDDFSDSKFAYDVIMAQRLMDKYKFIGEYMRSQDCGSRYVTSLDESEANDMNLIALQWTKKNQVNCDDVKDDEFTYSTCTNDVTKDLVYLYKYEDVLNKKKELFGSKSTLDKKVIHNISYMYQYIPKLNGYVTTACMCGYRPFFYDGKILAAKNVNDVITIRFRLETVGYEDGDSKISYYDYIFKLENDNYYLAEISEIK